MSSIGWVRGSTLQGFASFFLALQCVDTEGPLAWFPESPEELFTPRPTPRWPEGARVAQGMEPRAEAGEQL